MILQAGAHLGPYEILAPLGGGGMGEVYRARDRRLDRTVAIKVLAGELARTPELRARFEREARAVSRLQHPHICVLHDIGSDGGTDYLVMEHLEGESLAQRLARGPLPLELTLRYGRQIAAALDKAHRLGICHRDLKPANVMVTRSGVKLLDFGLARLPHALLAASPTETTAATAGPSEPLTAEGSIVGTLPYMAPEQLEGRADTRSDLWALGCVLYEMTTGRRPFGGTSQASLISAIMTAEPPPMPTVQPLTPPALDRLVRACLAKDPEDRWQSAHDVMAELDWIAEASPHVAAGGAVVAPPAAMTVRFEIGFAGSDLRQPSGDVPCSPELSPDGRFIVFVASNRGGRNQLWLRALDRLELRGLEGTAGAAFPFWSPDSRHIGFFADGKLRRIAVGGGPVQIVCEAEGGRGGSWSGAGEILFAKNSFSPLSLVAAAGGSPVQVTSLDDERKETSHRWPRFLPDGRRFLYFSYLSAQCPSSNGGTFVGSLGSSERRPLLELGSTCQLVAPERLLFFRDHNLMVQDFDAGAALLAGEPRPVAESVGYHLEKHFACYSAAAGVLAYAPLQGAVLTQLRWRDREGRDQGPLGDAAIIYGFRLSPDASRVALSVADPRTHSASLWIHEIGPDMMTRLTTGETRRDSWPVWSPDGETIGFSAIRQASANLFRVAANGSEREGTLRYSDYGEYAGDWSPDGAWLAFSRYDYFSDRSAVYAQPASGGGEPRLLVQSRFGDRSPCFSPDGRWIAYVSDESGRPEVYATPFPGPGPKRRISNRGGDQPRWRRDGQELFYISSDDVLMAVEVALAPELRTGLPRELFPLTHTRHGDSPMDYDTTDGQRFLVRTLLGEPGLPPFRVVLNWSAELDN